MWDVAKARRLRQFKVGTFHQEPGNYSISADGKLVGLITRQPGAGQLEIFNLTTGKTVRRIKIDQLQWEGVVRPAGVSFSDENKRVAVLFENRGQGLFLAWGGSSDVPTHHHIYPGGLLAKGVTPTAFEGSAFSLIDEGDAWLLYGASVFDTKTGKSLGELGLPNIRSQKVIAPDTAYLVQQLSAERSALLEVRLDFHQARRALQKN
ncbi:MAG: hypothetical protein H7144_03275 [Burkholderiales bacterium]|nr:hypothetical protein [Phycisphaerae bacterium]